MKQKIIFAIITITLWLLILLLGAKCSFASDRFDSYLKKYTQIYFSHAVDWKWFKYQTKAESNYNPNARSYAGAIGLMQLMPFTSRSVAREIGIPNMPLNPELNIHMGIYYDRKMWNIFSAEKDMERLRFMFGAYNCGPGCIIKRQRIAQQNDLCTNRWSCIKGFVPSETLMYVEKIQNLYLENKAYNFILDIRR